MSKSENTPNCHTFSNGIKVGYFVRNQAEDIQDESTYYIRKNHIVGNRCDEFIDLPESVLEDESGHLIKRINNLQIVNGGQTTASIFNTARKDKADISQIFVHVKLSVIKDPEQYSDIVSRISRYANTQNKVNDADFTANNPALISFQDLYLRLSLPKTICRPAGFLNGQEDNTKHCVQKKALPNPDKLHLILNIPKSRFSRKWN